MKAMRPLVALSSALLLVAISALSAPTRAALNGGTFAVVAGVCVSIALMILLRHKQPLIASSVLGLAVGALLSMAMAQQWRDRTPEHAHNPHLRPTPPALSDAVSVDQGTRFDVVLIFPQGTPALDLEMFMQTTLKRVHVQACVHNLPCIARLLRLSELGPARSEVIAFDLMGDTPQFERVALLSAAQHHRLKPLLFYSTSALAAVQIRQ